MAGMRQAVGAETVWKNRRPTRRGLVRLPLREAHNLNGQLNGRGWGSQFSKPFMPKRLMPTGHFNFGVRVHAFLLRFPNHLPNFASHSSGRSLTLPPIDGPSARWQQASRLPWRAASCRPVMAEKGPARPGTCGFGLRPNQATGRDARFHGRQDAGRYRGPCQAALPIPGRILTLPPIDGPSAR